MIDGRCCTTPCSRLCNYPLCLSVSWHWLKQPRNDISQQIAEDPSLYSLSNEMAAGQARGAESEEAAADDTRVFGSRAESGFAAT